MKKERILWLDYARMLAILSVVLVHCAEYAYSMSFDESYKLSTISVCFKYFCFVAGRLGVPLFLAISGYLLLDRDYSSSEKIIKFYKSSLLPLLLTTEIWVLIYFAAQTIKARNGIDFSVLIKDMLFIKENAYGHMWYMPMIIGIYVALPFVSNAIRGLPIKTLAIPFAVLVITVFGFKLLSVYNDICGWELMLSKKLFSDFLGGTYGAYVLLGYFCKKGAFAKVPPVALWLGALLSGAFSCFTLLYGMKKHYDYHIWYDFAGLFVCTVCLFELLSRINNQNKAVRLFGGFATSVSVLSLGMYFIHKPILSHLRAPIISLGLTRPVTCLLLAAIVLGISYLIALVVSKVPKIRKWLLFVKD